MDRERDEKEITEFHIDSGYGNGDIYEVEVLLYSEATEVKQ